MVYRLFTTKNEKLSIECLNLFFYLYIMYVSERDLMKIEKILQDEK